MRAHRMKGSYKRHGITYQQIAAEAGVTWHMVYLVAHQRRTSAKVLAAFERLLLQRTRRAEAAAARASRREAQALLRAS